MNSFIGIKKTLEIATYEEANKILKKVKGVHGYCFNK